MKRLALLLVAVALLWPAAANAQLTMQMSNGWTFSFAGNVNVFWVFTSRDSTSPASPKLTNSSIRTGLLPAFATFGAKGREAGMDLGIHFGFAPQVNNPGTHDEFGAQIDMRQVFLTVGGKWGQILAGRELGLFGRQNIINDQTLFGVGAVGIGNEHSGGTTLGRIGYGYIYPNFNAQVAYSTRSGRPAQLTVGIFQPSVVQSFDVTTVPRVEAELTYNKKQGKNSYLFWAGGLWQSAKDAPTGGNSISSVGGTAGVRASFSDLSVVVNGYIGKGLGTLLMFSGIEGGGVAQNGGGTELRTSDGGYVQVGYALNKKKTTIAGSWGFSRLKNNETAVASGGDGNSAVRTQYTLYTAGVYHQWTKSLKLVFEGGREQTGVGAASPAQFNVSGGFMLFY
jgi:hypothetical protein